jgi:hypothetical protein
MKANKIPESSDANSILSSFEARMFRLPFKLAAAIIKPAELPVSVGK